MRRFESDIVGGLFWMAVGFFFALGGVKLNMGTLRNPGPGFLPVIMAMFLILFSLFIFVKGLIRPMKPVYRISWRRHVFVIFSVLFYIFLLNWVGFLLSTFILMFFLFGLLIRGKNRWSKVFFYALTTALAAWLVFSVATKIPFPSPRLLAI
jgi:putative tricarboxylic transport membrane protein